MQNSNDAGSKVQRRPVLCTMPDAADILMLYKAARALQTQRKMVIWPEFERSFIEREIGEGRQWKVLIGDAMACNWAITFEDREIWGKKDRNDAIYIHRICVGTAFRGQRFIETMVKWAKTYAMQIGKRYVRLDTLGNNTRLIEHYTSAGFEYLGMFRLTDTASLPLHYQEVPDCCLFEIDLGQP